MSLTNLSQTPVSRRDSENPAPQPGPDPNPVESYAITRGERGVRCWVHRGHGVRSPLPHLMKHSEAFEIGYAGSGPSDLARSIVGDHFEMTKPEPTLYHSFKETFLASALVKDGCTITVAEIETWFRAWREHHREPLQLEVA